MPTKRTPISRYSAALNAAQQAFLYDRPEPNDPDDPTIWLEYVWLTASHRSPDDMPAIGRPSARKLWQEHGEAVLAEWIRAHPGERPQAWWRCAAPEPRLRLGGVGEPAPTREMWCGIASYWWRLVRGDPRYRRELSFDTADPPLFESQAAYLRRHDLLRPGEARRLKPSDFAPISITEIFDFGKAAPEAAGGPKAGVW
jgi:hypothetical protein